MKKLEIIIRPERLDDLKAILNECDAHGLMITNIMGYGIQRGHKREYNGIDFGGNLLPKASCSFPRCISRLFCVCSFNSSL